MHQSIYCHHPWCVGLKSFHKALIIILTRNFSLHTLMERFLVESLSLGMCHLPFSPHRMTNNPLNAPLPGKIIWWELQTFVAIVHDLWLFFIVENGKSEWINISTTIQIIYFLECWYSLWIGKHVTTEYIEITINHDIMMHTLTTTWCGWSWNVGQLIKCWSRPCNWEGNWKSFVKWSGQIGFYMVPTTISQSTQKYDVIIYPHPNPLSISPFGISL